MTPLFKWLANLTSPGWFKDNSTEEIDHCVITLNLSMISECPVRQSGRYLL